jgi:putative transposase
MSNEARAEGPKSDLICAVVEMKQRNPRWGCPRIAQQIALAFGIDINKDVVRRISPRITIRPQIMLGHPG